LELTNHSAIFWLWPETSDETLCQNKRVVKLSKEKLSLSQF
jgi:hypothetical protein